MTFQVTFLVSTFCKTFCKLYLVTVDSVQVTFKWRQLV